MYIFCAISLCFIFSLLVRDQHNRLFNRFCFFILIYINYEYNYLTNMCTLLFQANHNCTWMYYFIQQFRYTMAISCSNAFCFFLNNIDTCLHLVTLCNRILSWQHSEQHDVIWDLVATNICTQFTFKLFLFHIVSQMPHKETGYSIEHWVRRVYSNLQNCLLLILKPN